MSRLRNGKLKIYSRQLRTNMTEEERKLWYTYLKSCGTTFYRQRVFGNYIVDFYCPSAKLIIELDGSQHYEDKGETNDKIRDNYFRDLGITVLRFSNLQINREFESVINTIYTYIKN